MSYRPRLTIHSSGQPGDPDKKDWRFDRPTALAYFNNAMGPGGTWLHHGYIDPVRAAVIRAHANAPGAEEVRFTLTFPNFGATISVHYTLDLRP